MRRRFNAQLAALNKAMMEMGTLCVEVISLASIALARGSKEFAAQIAPIDREIGQKERDIESLCLKLLLQQQPMARDLRMISAALKMITDMARIGKQAEDIAEIITFLEGRSVNAHIHIDGMAKATMNMVQKSVDAYVSHDTALAHDVIACDDVVDAYFDEIKNSLIETIAQNPADGQYALDLLMIAKYFERIGDHSVNVAHWVVFSVTGIHKEE